jgi:hypothetical protein
MAASPGVPSCMCAGNVGWAPDAGAWVATQLVLLAWLDGVDCTLGVVDSKLDVALDRQDSMCDLHMLVHTLISCQGLTRC